MADFSLVFNSVYANENLKSLVTTKEDIKFNLESKNQEKLVLELEKINNDVGKKFGSQNNFNQNK